MLQYESLTTAQNTHYQLYKTDALYKCERRGFIYLNSDYTLIFYPPKRRAERTRWGPLDSLSI